MTDKREYDEDDPIAAMMLREPVPARIISDDRQTWLRMIARISVILVLLFFVATGYRQTADTHIATMDTHHLVKQLQEEVNSNRSTNNELLRQQAKLLGDNAKLRHILRRQNTLLHAAGLPTVHIPDPSSVDVGNGSVPVTSDTPTPSHRPAPAPHPTHDPSPRSPKPRSPKPTPNPIKTALCILMKPTGGCRK